MKKTVFLVIVTILCFFCLATAQAQKSNKSKKISQPQTKDNVEIPEIATKPSNFTPKGWRVIQKTFGDLNDDNLSDVAIVLEKEDRKQYEEEGEGDRVLVIAFRGEEGFRRVAVARDLLFNSKGAGAKASEPLKSVHIKKGVLTVSQISGSPSSFGGSEVSYRYQDGQFVEISNSENHNSSFASDNLLMYARNYNLVTGFVVEDIRAKLVKNLDETNSVDVFTRDEDILADATIITRKWYMLRAGKSSIAPVIDGKILTDEWAGLTVDLQNKSNIVKGLTYWNGQSDLSAKLSALVNDDHLYIRAEVIDNQITEEDRVQLITKKAQIIKPIESKQIKEGQGYVFEAKYNLKELETHKMKYENLLKLTVEIIDVDEDKKLTKVMSTSCDGKKYAAGILISPNVGLPTLK